MLLGTGGPGIQNLESPLSTIWTESFKLEIQALPALGGEFRVHCAPTAQTWTVVSMCALPFSSHSQRGFDDKTNKMKPLSFAEA